MIDIQTIGIWSVIVIWLIDMWTMYNQSYYSLYAIILWSIYEPSIILHLMYHQLVYDWYTNNWYMIDDRNRINWYMNDTQSIILQSICNHLICERYGVDQYTINGYFRLICAMSKFHWTNWLKTKAACGKISTAKGVGKEDVMMM